MKRLPTFLLGLALALGLSSAQGISPVPFLGMAMGDVSLVFQNDFTAGSLVSQKGPILSFTRATASTFTDHEDRIRSILSGEARFHKLRRVENLLAATEDLTSASWSKLEATVSANQTTDPLGGTAADKLIEGSGTVSPRVEQGITYAAGGVYVLSAYVKNAGRNFAELRIYQDGTTDKRAAVNLTTGVVTTFGTVIYAGATNVGNGWWRLSLAATTNATGGAGHASVTVRETAIATVYTGNGVDGIYVWGGQLEHITGAAIQVVSEYVSKGVLSSPWHGAGVDGVKYFNTANGNTVASNVVTEATGAALTLTSAGLWVNEAATNIVLQSEDHGTTWVAVPTTSPTRVAANARVGDVVLDLLGDDSAALAAGYEQAVTFTGDAVKSVAVYMKAGTSTSSVVILRDSTALADRLLATIAWSGGVPTVTMTTGTHEGTDTLANGTYRFRFATTSVTAANTNNLRIFPATDAALLGTNTGTVNVGGWMVRNALVSAPYVKTTTAAVTVNADVVTAATSGIAGFNAAALTMYAKATLINVTGSARELAPLHDGSTNERLSFFLTAPSRLGLDVVDGGVGQVSATSVAAVSAGTTFRAAYAAKANDFALVLDGASPVIDASGSMPTVTTLEVGSIVGAVSWLNAPIQEVRLYNTRKSNAELQAMTAP